MNVPEPEAKASVDPNFEMRLRDGQVAAEQEYQARQLGNQVTWCRPTDWDDDYFDLDAMAEPFDSSSSSNDYLEAMEDPSEPGTVGDVVVTTTMIDYLAVMERAFRMRHTMRRPRAIAHLLGRKMGQGNVQGPLTGTLEYIRNIMKQSASD